MVWARAGTLARPGPARPGPGHGGGGVGGVKVIFEDIYKVNSIILGDSGASKKG